MGVPEKEQKLLTIGAILVSAAVLAISGLFSSIVWGLLMVCIIAGVYFYLLYR